MANTTLWKKRVEAWRASGLSSEAFSQGKDFSAGGLRHWAHQLRQVQSRCPEPARKAVRLVQVMRTPEVPVPAEPLAPVAPSGEAGEGSPAEAAIVLELAGARIGVKRGFDPETLVAVLDVLSQRSTAAGRAS